MAKRSREHRQEIPGYENRPTREERKQQHRKVRHNTHQMLHVSDDPEEIAGLPEVRPPRQPEDESAPEAGPDPGRAPETGQGDGQPG